MELNPDIEQRIYEAADKLFAGEGGARMPTVDAVRKLARTNMNDTSIAMKVWRANKRTVPTALMPVVPDVVRRVFETALAELWGVAQAQANSALNAAQASWDTERAEAEEERQNLTLAFDEQSSVLEEYQRENAASAAASAALAASEAAIMAQLTTRNDECLKLQSADAAHRILVSELRSHIDDLRRESDQSNGHTARLKRDLDEACIAADVAAKQFARERAVLNSDIDRVATREIEARETAITLRGQMDALTKQNADLLAKLRPTKSPAP